jgi:YVTN family beta-propeller protein
VPGTAKGSGTPEGPTKGDEGDVVHVFDIDPASGHATEQDPISLPQSGPGSAQRNSLPPVTADFPTGTAVSPDGGTLAVVLSQADRLALIDTATRQVRTAPTGAYPAGVAIKAGAAYVSNEYDGTLSVIDTATGATRATIPGLGGERGDRNSHPVGVLADPARDRVYAAVANRDLVAVVNTAADTVEQRVSVARGTLGTQPTALAISPDGATLYSADSNEDAVAAIALAGKKPYTVIGKIPTAAYPTDVEVTPDGATLLWTAGKGLGAGPNPGYKFAGAKKEYTTPDTPYGTYVPDMLLGRVGVLARPTGQGLAQLTKDADAQVVPANAQKRPPGNPVPAPGSGPSAQIRHVFYIVRENRTYDQVFGRDPRGDGDPSLELFGDNVQGTPDATQGITPNAHALSRAFPLLDHLYADSEVSVDGHLITAGAIATDYVQKATQANYSNRGRAFDFGIYPVTFGPNDFVFDQAARQSVSFFNYGEQAAGSTPLGDDGRPTYDEVFANTDQTTYAGNLFIGCQSPPQPPANCTQDSQTAVPTGNQSRVAAFRQRFAAQLAANRVPSLNYLILPNDHTNGTTPDGYSPQALIADNDLALGQLVETISHSSIWPDTAIFVVEDDSQDGADHVDAHRMPALVISPWARQGVVSDRYDQYSVLRTVGLLLGLQPLSLNDELATPMYDAFQATRRTVTYDAVTPQQSLTEKNPPDAPMGGISSRLPYSHLDLVPQALSDEILWKSAHGARSTPPAPGPNASREEHERALGVRRVLRRGGDARAWLRRHAEDEGER